MTEMGQNGQKQEWETEIVRIEWKEQKEFKNAFRCAVIGRSKIWVWKKVNDGKGQEKTSKMGIGRSEVSQNNIMKLWLYQLLIRNYWL